MNLTTLQLPTCLTMGNKPFSQVSAFYHYHLSQGSYSTQMYSSEWGWTIVETQNFIAFIKEWHDLCNINNNSHGSYHSSIVVVGGSKNNKEEIDNNNKATTTTKGKLRTIRFTKLQLSIPVAKNTLEDLYQYFTKNTRCVDLLEYWLELYMQFGYSSPSTIDPKQLGTISAVVRQNNDDKARLIFQWIFNCNEGKASFMKKSGYVFPSSLVSRGSIVENYNLAKNWKELDNKEVKPLGSYQDVPTFDKNGNLIEGGK